MQDTPMGLLATLTHQWGDDRHFVAYEPVRIDTPDARGWFRMKTDVLDLGTTIKMTLLVFDVDAPDHNATPEWRAEVEARIPEGVLWYRTNGGVRLVFLLTSPFVIADRKQAAEWSDFYEMCCSALERLTSIVADRTCKDVFRIYRLPRVARKTVKGEAMICPVPADWTPTTPTVWDDSVLLESDVPVEPNKVTELGAPSGEVEDTRLFRILEAAEWPFEDTHGEWTNILCPWHEEHTTGGELAGIKGNNDNNLNGPGVFNCWHSHCQGRTTGHVFAHPLIAPHVAAHDAKVRAQAAEWSASVGANYSANDTGNAEEPAPAPKEEPAPKDSNKRVNPLLACSVGWSQIQQPLPPVDWLCRDLDLAAGRASLWIGHSHSGKSLAAMFLAVAVASGKPAFGAFPVRQGAVVHIDLDTGAAATKAKYQRLAIGMGCVKDELPLTVIPPGAFKLLDRQSVEDLAEVCTGKALCIVDAFRHITEGEDSAVAYAEPLVAIRRVSEATGCAFIVIHHTVKSKGVGASGTTALLAASGSGAIGQHAGSMMLVEREESCSYLRRVKASEHDEKEDFAPVELVLKRGSEDPELGRAGMLLTVAPKESKAEKLTKEESHIRFAVRNALENTPGLSAKDLAGLCQKKEARVKEALDRMLTDPIDRIHSYSAGHAGKRRGFFLATREDMVRKVLRGGGQAESALGGLTGLHKSEVRDALDTLQSRHLVTAVKVCEVDGWMLTPAGEGI